MREELAALGARFEGMPYHHALGIRIEALDTDHAVLRVPYKDENSNPGKALHGGVAASTVDIGGSLAAWTGLRAAPGLDAATIDLSVQYLAAAIGEDIVAEAEVLRRGKEIVYSVVTVRNDAGKPIAKGLAVFRALNTQSQPRALERQFAAVPDTVVVQPAGCGGEVPELAHMIVAVPFMARLGLDITHMKNGLARLAMPFKPEHTDGEGATHEGALAALIDTAGAMASWSITGIDFRYKASTVAIHVNYHAPARGEDVVARARTLRRNNEVFLNDVAVTGHSSGRLIATGAVTYRIVVSERAESVG